MQCQQRTLPCLPATSTLCRSLHGWARHQHPPPVVTVVVVIVVVVAAPASLGACPPILLIKEPQAMQLVLELLALAVLQLRHLEPEFDE